MLLQAMKKEHQYCQEYSPNVKEEDYIILESSDSKHIIAQAIKMERKPVSNFTLITIIK